MFDVTKLYAAGADPFVPSLWRTQLVEPHLLGVPHALIRQYLDEDAACPRCKPVSYRSGNLWRGNARSVQCDDGSTSSAGRKYTAVH